MLEVKVDSLKGSPLGKSVPMNMLFLDPRLREDDDFGLLKYRVILNGY